MRAKTCTVSEAADYIGVSWHTLRVMVQRGQIPSIRIGQRERLRWDDVERLLATGSALSQPAEAAANAT